MKQGPERNIVIAMSCLCLLLWLLWLVTVIETQVRTAMQEAVASGRPPVATPWIYKFPFAAAMRQAASARQMRVYGPLTYNSVQTMEPSQ